MNLKTSNDISSCVLCFSKKMFNACKFVFTAMSDVSPGSFENNQCTGKFNPFMYNTFTTTFTNSHIYKCDSPS